MGKYSLKRGIVSSDAQHISTLQYYRDLLNQPEDIQEDIDMLLERREEAERELFKIKSETKTEKLKNTVKKVITAITSEVVPFFWKRKTESTGTNQRRTAQ
ncbi:hypothetical protein [Parabacteroides pacaensis]|uniref:hypothetical protein n=1 Tax=Parabacteroides pacaensis TaxID=2086575 RepID=UPI0018FEECDB|nr:hypothetical protein [Parabacteroides pacaensis]